MAKKTTIYTSGKKTDGVHFQGEVMMCAICRKVQVSDPTVQSGWTYVEVGDEKGGYICPDELPRPTASREQYIAAWEKILRLLIG